MSTREKLTIKCNNKIKSVVAVNVLGEIVLQKQIANVNNKILLDVSVLRKGIYFLKCVTDKGVGVKKFVKN